MAARRGVAAADMRRLLLTRIIPIGLILGASMETFMYFTGFWSVATRKEAERREEKRQHMDMLKQRSSQPDTSHPPSQQLS
jgi:hypothetical protein